jgi:hypothetical protein
MYMRTDYFLFLRNIRNLIEQRRTPSAIINYYQNIIAKRQEERIKHLSKVFSLIDTYKRSHSFTTDNEEQQKLNTFVLKVLSNLDRDIRHDMFKEDEDFINSIKKVINFKLD